MVYIIKISATKLTKKLKTNKQVLYFFTNNNLFSKNNSLKEHISKFIKVNLKY